MPAWVQILIQAIEAILQIVITKEASLVKDPFVIKTQAFITDLKTTYITEEQVGK